MTDVLKKYGWWLLIAFVFNALVTSLIMDKLSQPDLMLYIADVAFIFMALSLGEGLGIWFVREFFMFGMLMIALAMEAWSIRHPTRRR